MLKTIPRSDKISAPRILRPGRLLETLRPLTLKCVAGELYDALYCAQTLKLVQTHFPEKLPDYEAASNDWDSMLRSFLITVEGADWFEVDWEILDQLWDMWVNNGDDNYRHDMAAYLTGVPVRCYGFTEWDRDREKWMYVLHGIMSENGTISPDHAGWDVYHLLASAGELTAWGMQEKVAAADFSAYPEPLCRLGEIAMVAAGKTGNLILDTTLDHSDWWPDYFTWDKDIARLREAWQTAKPVARHLAEFSDWMDTGDEDERILTMVEVLLGVNDEP